jgi:hypothetical protein
MPALFDLARQTQTLDGIVTEFPGDSHNTHPTAKHHWPPERPLSVANFRSTRRQTLGKGHFPQVKQPIRVPKETERPRADATPLTAVRKGAAGPECRFARAAFLRAASSALGSIAPRSLIRRFREAWDVLAGESPALVSATCGEQFAEA